MIKNTKLSFSIIDTHSCHTFGIADLSYYNPLQEIKNATLQVITPFDDEAVEVRYNKNSITNINSSSSEVVTISNSSSFQNDTAYIIGNKIKNVERWKITHYHKSKH